MAINTERVGVIDLEFNPQGQMFASRETIRAAIFDVLDVGFNGFPWHFDPDDESDEQSEHRHDFADRVQEMIVDLQSPPFDHVKLENLCDFHKRRALPVPTSQSCAVCEKERKVKA